MSNERLNQENEALHKRVSELESALNNLHIELKSKKATDELTGRKVEVDGVEYDLWRGPKGGLFYYKYGYKKEYVKRITIK